MQAVILAGGLGERMRPLTHITAKLMLKVYGKPFLEHQIGSLKASGITDIVLLVGHLAGQIKSYFGNGDRFSVNIVYSEDDMLGTGGAIKNAAGVLDDVFIVLNGDTYLPIDYHDVVKRFYAEKKPALMVLYDNSENIGKNNVAVLDKAISEYDNKETKPYFTHLDAGVSVFSKKVFDSMDKKAFQLDDVYMRLIPQRQLANFVTSHRFLDIHFLERLENIRKCFE